MQSYSQHKDKKPSSKPVHALQHENSRIQDTFNILHVFNSLC